MSRALIYPAMERAEKFLKELKELEKKYGVQIDHGCFSHLRDTTISNNVGGPIICAIDCDSDIIDDR